MNIPSGPLGLMVAYLENGQKVYIQAPQPNPEATMNEFVPNIDNRKPMLYNMLPNPLPIHNTYAPLMVTSEQDAAQEEIEEERILSQAVHPKIVEGHIEAEFPRLGLTDLGRQAETDLGRKRRVTSPGLSPNQANKKSFELRNPQNKDYPVNITQEEPIEMKIQLQMDIAMAGQRIPSDKILEISPREMLKGSKFDYEVDKLREKGTIYVANEESASKLLKFTKIANTDVTIFRKAITVRGIIKGIPKEYSSEDLIGMTQAPVKILNAERQM